MDGFSAQVKRKIAIRNKKRSIVEKGKIPGGMAFTGLPARRGPAAPILPALLQSKSPAGTGHGFRIFSKRSRKSSRHSHVPVPDAGLVKSDSAEVIDRAPNRISSVAGRETRLI